MEKLKHVTSYNQKYELFHNNLVEVINKNPHLRSLTKKELKNTKSYGKQMGLWPQYEKKQASEKAY